MKRPWQIWILFVVCLAIVLTAMGWLTFKVLELDRAGETFRDELSAARQQAEEHELISTALWRLDWTLTPLVAQEAARPYFAYQPFYEVSLSGSQGGKDAESWQDKPAAGNPGRTSKPVANSDDRDPDDRDPAGGKRPRVKESGKQPVKGQPSGKPQPAKKVQQIASPLLVQPSDYVLLHFELSPSESWTSPQSPMTATVCNLAVANGATLDNIKVSSQRLSELKETINHPDLLAMLPDQLLPPMDMERPANGPGQYSLNYDGEFFNQNAEEPGPAQQAAYNDLGLRQIDEQLKEVEQQNQAEYNPGDLPNPSTNVRQQAGGQGGNPGGNVNPPPLQTLMLRGGNEWRRRNRAYQSYANSIARQQRVMNVADVPVSLVREGVSRPVWVDSKLILARRVILNDRVIIQGCWLNWERIKQVLLTEIADLLPAADLVPATPNGNISANRALATLPVQLVPGAITSTGPMPAPPSALRISLWIAWVSLGVATIAVGIVLRGVVKLSERRGAFVSAVTHELRTPLTTFRMYAEMLSQGMVPDAEQRQRYLDTLRVEADRLAHLVENVLQYAQLERGRPGKRCEPVRVSDLLARCVERLRDRAGQAEMKLVVDVDKPTLEEVVRTDPIGCEQILFNLVDNACKYAAHGDDRTIRLSCRVAGRWLAVTVRDFGPGISLEQQRRLFRPFSKTDHDAANSAPGVGLGLALCRRLAGQLGGRLQYLSDNPPGATFILSLPRR